MTTLLEAGTAVADLAGRITNPAAPGLGEWDIAGLAGHLLRALRTPITYLGRDPAQEPAHVDAVDYFIAYLDRRERDPAHTDAAVAERGVAELADADAPAIAAAFVTTLRDLEAALNAAPPDFLIAGPFGGIALDAYLETRIFEATVHGLDLAQALSLPAWRPPDRALRVSLTLLTDIALRRDDATRLLGMLTGREWADVAPLLR